MAKLTLSINKSIALRAKRYSKRRGVSVSKLVEEYLDLITTPPQAADVKDVPDEITIVVAEDGTVTMNEEEFDTPKDKKLPRLTNDLIKLRKDADNRGGKVLVTLQTEEQAKYERVIDVLNALGKAQLTNVTFTVGNEEP